MRIERIDIEGFGALPELDVDLIPRVNLFVGENEAGKSTLQQAVLALLFGFYQGNRVTPTEKAEHEAFRPWQGGSYGGSLDYALDSGERFRIRRSFDTDDLSTTVSDLATGRDITRDLGMGRHGNVPVGRAHLGMGQDVFRSTCFVDQAAVVQIGAPQAVAETVASIADTATVDTSAARAVARLDEARAKQVGGPRARVTPLPLAMERLGRAREELRHLEQDQSAIQDGMARKDKLEELCKEEKKQLDLITYLKVSARLGEAEGTLDRLRRMGQELAGLEEEAETLRKYDDFAVEVKDTVLSGKGRLEALTQQTEELRGKWEQTSLQLDELQGEIGRSRQEIERLEYARAFPLYREETFDRLRFSLEEASSRLNSLRQELANMQRKEAMRSRVGRLPKAVPIVGLTLAVVLGVSSAVAGFVTVGLPLAIVMAVASYLLLRSASRSSPLLEGTKQTVQDEEKHVLQLGHELGELFKEAGIEVENMDAGIDMFHRRSGDRKELDRLEERIRTLEEGRKGLLSLKQQVEDSQNQVDEAKEGLLKVLRRARIDATNVEEGIALFAESYGKRLRLDEVRQKAESLKGQRGALLGDRTEAMLTALRDDLELQKSAALAATPQVSGAVTDKSLQELEIEEGQLRQEISRMEQEMSGLGGSIEATLGKHRQRSEIEEDVARYESEVRRLQRFASALDLAKDVLQKATEEVHRDFAPRLAQSLGQTLSLITQGRYGSAFVDPKDFSISIQAPETGDIVKAGDLSLGTREQAYLTLRIELARMLSANHETLPLLLDDPFVNFDDRRLQRTVQLLVDISQDNQVVLFTKDPFILQWFRANCQEGIVFKVHELPLSPV